MPSFSTRDNAPKNQFQASSRDLIDSASLGDPTDRQLATHRFPAPGCSRLLNAATVLPRPSYRTHASTGDLRLVRNRAARYPSALSIQLASAESLLETKSR
jgi:hypothetical protein